ncbi:BrnT family toxin [Neorhizobium galegae]|nr:BrnT family toxin [Neorhizobium galegae]MCM2498321.1 BrnT family toxin [Neorhizobium galegae]MCQ1774290.1 BrnT family toxin [Neorhizobium galegae]MCQ1779197.1 BrnT family toxin [Neorhizobium galegae]MCQ1796018.1 BrnT family toxin [Neorhizobium galegae]
MAVCPEQRRLIAVVYTMRGEVCRIISARTASKHEQRAYRQIFG